MPLYTLLPLVHRRMVDRDRYSLWLIHRRAKAPARQLRPSENVHSSALLWKIVQQSEHVSPSSISSYRNLPNAFHRVEFVPNQQRRIEWEVWAEVMIIRSLNRWTNKPWYSFHSHSFPRGRVIHQEKGRRKDSAELVEIWEVIHSDWDIDSCSNLLGKV